MKRLVFFFLFIVWALGLLANPMEFLLVSEFWFNNQGQMLIELCPSYSNSSLDIPLSDLRFTYDGQTSSIPDTQDSLFYYSPAVVNLSELDPPLYPHSWDGGTVSVSLADGGYSGEEISWITNVPSYNASLVRWYSHYVTRSWNWAIDVPPTQGTHPYCPQSRGTVRAYCHDQFGNPMPGVHVTFFMDGPHGGETDANGVFQDTLYCSPMAVYAYYPEPPTRVFEASFWLQPNQMTVVDIPITITANGDAVVLPTATNSMKIYPVPYRLSQSAGLCFQLPETARKSRKVTLKIYNTKGQYVTEVTTPRDGKLEWQPEKDISAGVYTAQLICDNRIVETAQFSLMK